MRDKQVPADTSTAFLYHPTDFAESACIDCSATTDLPIRRDAQPLRSGALATFDKETKMKTQQTHRRGLLAWYNFRISTGPLEGLNNKLRTLQRTAYGDRDQADFRLKLYALHTTPQSLKQGRPLCLRPFPENDLRKYQCHSGLSS